MDLGSLGSGFSTRGTPIADLNQSNPRRKRHSQVEPADGQSVAETPSLELHIAFAWREGRSLSRSRSGSFVPISVSALPDIAIPELPPKGSLPLAPRIVSIARGNRIALRQRCIDADQLFASARLALRVMA